MQPQQPLTIYEIRALPPFGLDIFDQPHNFQKLGANACGLHWEEDFAFIFFAGEPTPQALSYIQSLPQLQLCHIHHLSYAQWQDGAGAEPFTVQGLTIAPPEGEEHPSDSGTLYLDPGLAFGFGGHPTTRTCLDFLARACLEKGGPPASALDLGAGTGILSLAAARWGVSEILGIDFSHLAVDAALHNLALNDLSGQVTFRRGPAQDYAHHQGEILLANLHLSLQLELFDLGAFLHRRRVIISGLLPCEGDELRGKLQGLGLKLMDQVRTDRWITMFLGQEVSS